MKSKNKNTTTEEYRKLMLAVRSKTPPRNPDGSVMHIIKDTDGLLYSDFKLDKRHWKDRVFSRTWYK